MVDKDLYFVAVKIFLTDKAGRLLLIHDRFGAWDLPGGRLRKNDFSTPLEKVAVRKMREELGEKLKYRLNRPAVFMRHERMEILPSGKKGKRRIFAVGYEAKYLGGEIILGKNHLDYNWVPRREFRPENFFTGGWLRGVREYLDFIKRRTSK